MPPVSPVSSGRHSLARQTNPSGQAPPQGSSPPVSVVPPSPVGSLVPEHASKDFRQPASSSHASHPVLAPAVHSSKQNSNVQTKTSPKQSAHPALMPV